MSADAPIVWLASFPKSGNTWMRAIITAARGGDRLFAVDKLSSGSQPHLVGGANRAFGLDPRWLTVSELRTLRDSLVALPHDRPAAEGPTISETKDVITLPESALAASPTDAGPGEPAAPSVGRPATDSLVFRKTHEVYRYGALGAQPFPNRVTRAAILIVRDPRAVACSWAPFFGVSLDQAVARIGREQPDKASPARAQTEQPWGTWSDHANSWLSAGVPFPVHMVRYEDLQADAMATLLPVFAAVGWSISQDELAVALKRTAFDRLKTDEQEQGFRESSAKTQAFFRSGQAAKWRSELTESQVQQVEMQHSEMMQRLGYEPVVARS
ncbi:MAG: sulfotransferase domain-containing protein [Actinomycetia bacterium]|nr:sulfotransferase domain-containing protein [Actinomycetes bacterium]